MTSITQLPSQPEILLACQEGIKSALKAITKTAGTGDLRDLARPDQTLRGLVIDLQLEIDQIDIGHDTDKTPTCSIPMLAAMALLIKRMGITRESGLNTLRDVMKEAMTLGKDASKALLEESGVAAAQQRIKDEVIATLPRTRVRKSIKVKGAKLVIKAAGTDPKANAA